MSNTTILPFDDPNEKIFRAVKPSPLFWASEDRVTSCVFDLRVNETGLSFDRANGRSDKSCCDRMHKNLEGAIISLKAEICFKFKEINLEHDPSHNNPYHSQLYYSTENRNTLKQIKHQLASHAYKEKY